MRKCGDCTLCCKLLAVRTIDKKAGERCKHQRHTGCRVYHGPDMPPECVLWNCRWLLNDAGETSRPDRSHIVIDVMPDYITLPEINQNAQVVQCWIDPRYPDAHRDPAFRAFVESEAMEGRLCMLRFNGQRAAMLFPPSLTGGEWVLRDSQLDPKFGTSKSHSAEDIFEALTEIANGSGRGADQRDVSAHARLDQAGDAGG